MIDPIKASWKTTATGIGGLLVIVGGVLQVWADGNPDTNPQWEIVMPALILAIGQIMSRDADKSSEEAGLK